jgi:hypothetical protein
MALGSIKNQWAVLQSRDALNMLRGMWYDEKPEYLEIVSSGPKIEVENYGKS